MQYLTLFLAITIISIVIAIKLKIRTEQAIPITVIGLVILVYITGILGNLKVGIYLIIITVLLSLMYILYYLKRYKDQRRNFIKEYCTPGVVIYGITYIVFVLLNKNRIFENYDEFNHWGLIIKDMYINDSFAFEREAITKFSEYPPFTAIFEYILLKFSGSYSEDIIIIANNILSISIMMPIFKKANWNKSLNWIFVIIPIIICIPMIIYKNFYFNILVDGLIGIFIAYIIYQWFTNEKNKVYRNISTSFGMIAITLIKSSGIGIAIILTIILLGDCIRKKLHKEKVKKDVLTILIIFSIAIFMLGIWNFNIYRNNQSKNWNMENISLENVFQLIKGNEPNGKDGFTSKYIESIFDRTTITERNLTIITSTLLIISINIYVYKKMKDETIKKKYKYYSIMLYIFGFLYLIYMLFVYLFLFNDEETMAFSSFERYFGTIFLGLVMFHIWIGIEEQKQISTTNISIILCIILIFLPVQTIEEKIINGKREKIIAITDRKTYTKILNYKEKISMNDKIYYIDTTENTAKYSLQIMKYQMLPIKIDSESIVLDTKELKEIWEENGYTYLYIQKANDLIKEKFRQEFSKELEDRTMYRIMYEGEMIKLEKVE